MPETHALASAKSLTMQDLAHESLLLLEDGHCLRDQALDVCHLAGAGEKSGFRATSLELLGWRGPANVGIPRVVVASVTPPVAPSQDVHLLPFDAPAPSRRIAMVWRRSSAMSEFLEKPADVFRELPPDLLSTESLPRRSGAARPRPRPRA